MSRLLFTIALSFAAIGAWASPRDFKIDVRPAFEGPSIWASAPLIVDIENKGADAKGSLYLGDQSDVTRYPIDLPRGSRKQPMVYPSPSAYGPAAELIMDTDQGRFPIQYQIKSSMPSGQYSNFVAMVADNSGELAFIRPNDRSGNGNGTNMVYDCYAKPEDFPERPLALNGCNAVVLGSGSERLTDGAVRALKTYALTGGTILFIGGASATILEDPRWVDLLPIRSTVSKTLKHSDILENRSGANLDESFTVSAGTPAKGATVQSEQGVPIIAERNLGLGRIVVLAVNPFEEPFVRWSGRARLMMSLIRSTDYIRANGFLGQFQSESNSYERYSGYATPGGPAYYPGSYDPNRQKSDPFSVKLPPASKVFWTLAFFFLAVVPINFFVLRKMKKAEWAWATSPIICFIFAGIFLNQASELYSAKLSTATSGLWLQQEAVADSLFVGKTQMFFPNGGSYDLKLKDVDQLGAGNPYDYYDASSRTELNPIDVGMVLVPSLRAANLAFEEISYRQRIPTKPEVQIEPINSSSLVTNIRIRNRGSGVLHDISIAARGRRIAVKDLQPGQSADVAIPNEQAPDDRQNVDAITAITRTSKSVIVVATIETLRPGPQIGQEVAARSSIRLAYFSQPDVVGGGK